MSLIHNQGCYHHFPLNFSHIPLTILMSWGLHGDELPNTCVRVKFQCSSLERFLNFTRIVVVLLKNSNLLWQSSSRLEFFINGLQLMFKEFLGKYAMTCEFTTRRLPRSSSRPDVLPQTIRADSPSLTQMCSFETKEDKKNTYFF